MINVFAFSVESLFFRQTVFVPMKRALYPVLGLLAAVLPVPAHAGLVSQTFTGVTVSQPSELDAEFPAGTRWTLLVEWNDAAPPRNPPTPTQSRYALTKLTVTLHGKNGSWTTSAKPGQPSFGLNKNAGGDEIQFTGGWGPDAYTNPVIGSLQPYSVNFTLGDPTKTALAALTPAPGPIDAGKWSPAITHSYLKVYLNNDGDKYIQGSVDFSPVVSVKQVGGANLRDGKSSVRFKPTSVGKRSAKKVLLVSNAGSVGLVGLSAKLSGAGKRDYAVSAKGSKNLAPGTSKRVEVVFRPKRPGTRKAALKLASKNAGKPLFGVGLVGKATAAP